MNVDALVITLPGPAYRGREGLSTGGAGDRRYRAGVPYSADRLHQLHLGVWQRQRYSEGIPARLPQTASGQVLKELEDWPQPAGRRWILLRRAGGAFPSSGTFFAGKSAPDGQHVVNLVHLQDVVAAIELLLQAPKGGTSIIYVRPSIRRAASFIRRWPASSVAAAGVQRQRTAPGQDCGWQSYLQ